MRENEGQPVVAGRPELGVELAAEPALDLGRRPVLHRRGVYACFLIISVFSTLIAVPSVIFAVPSDPWGPWAVVVAISALVVSLVWFGLSHLRQYAGTPARLVVLSLWWGATSAGVLAYLTSAEDAADIARKLGWRVLEDSFAGAWPEEITKALGIWMVLWIGRDWWNRPWHGALAGAFVGLGFEVYENSLYALLAGVTHASSDVAGVLGGYGLRLLFGGGLHVFFSGLVGFGIAQALWGAGRYRERGGKQDLGQAPGQSRSRAWRFGQVFGWGGLGFALHFLWNISWPEPIAVVVLLLIWAAALGIFLWLVLRQHRALGVGAGEMANNSDVS